MKDVLRMLLKFCLFLVCGVVFVWLFMQFMNGVALADAFSSVVMLVIMFVVFIRSDVTWKRPQRALLFVCGLAFVAVFVDSRGNLLYNLPLQLLAPAGTVLETVVSSNSIEGKLATVDYKLLFVDGSGQVVGELERKVIWAFRFFEYLAIGCGLVFLYGKFGYLLPKRWKVKDKK